MTSGLFTASILGESSAPALARQQVGGCSAKTVFSAILVVALLAAAALLCVWSRTEVMRKGYALSRTAEEIKALNAEHERLRVEAVRLKTPERIERIARQRLGMVYPDPSQVMVIKPSWGKNSFLAALPEQSGRKKKGGETNPLTASPIYSGPARSIGKDPFQGADE